jgi:glycolate oxidase
MRTARKRQITKSAKHIQIINLVEESFVSANMVNSIVNIAGEGNVSCKEADLVCYSSDLAPLPDIIISTYGIKTPSIVARPKNADQVSEIIKLANKEKTPVTPRGGASSAHGGSLPLDGGIVLDMTSMDKILSIDEDKMCVCTQPGVTFAFLTRELLRKNLKLGCFPSSALSATVGGYISNGGCAGIGAPRYGPIRSHIMQLEAVLPDGEKLSVCNPYSTLFVGAEGTLGVITQVTLRVFPIPEFLKAVAFGFDDVLSAFCGLENLFKSGIKPYFLSFMDGNFLETMSKLGKEVPKHSMIILVALEGCKKSVETQETAINKIFSKGKQLPDTFAVEEWNNVHKTELFIKRAGPTLVVAEANVPIFKLKQALKNLKDAGDKLGLNICLYGILGYGGSTLTMPIVLTDERKEDEYFNTLLASLKMTSVIISTGGTVYGVGLHNSIFMERINGVKRLEIMKRLKKSLDPNKIMNPGKLTECRMAWLSSLIAPR